MDRPRPPGDPQRPQHPQHLSRRSALRHGLLAIVGSSCARLARALPDPQPLITKPIPSTGERLPAVGLGTDSFEASDRDAIRAEITRMHELGGTVIDTAAAYGDSEALIGDALASAGIRDAMFLATKLTGSGASDYFGGDARGPEGSLKRSLDRLRTHRLDLLQVHNLDGVDTLIPLLRKWKQAGTIRYYGVTTSRVSQHEDMAEVMRKYPLDFIQVDYSIANRDAEKTIFPLALERRIAVLANLPLVHGRLMRQVRSIPLPSWAGDLGITSWSQFLLKYVISHPAVTCAIPGSTRVAHLEDNQKAARGVLPDAAMRVRMEQYFKEKV
ncbi:MAG TPA: aldo/keto reductase [Steroidobacteraceae bacterium]|nr:aldo/keto reductase [Steroidobacteraceae bacterium]